MTNEDLKRFYAHHPNKSGDDFARISDVVGGNAANGIYVTSFDTISHTIVDDETVNLIRATFSDGSTHDFDIHVHNGFGSTDTNHAHANKAILDKTTASFTTRDQANINNAIQLAAANELILENMHLHDIELTQTDGYFDSVDALPEDKHIHFLFELETAGAHSGADFVLHPYNGAVCNICFTILVNGQFVNGFAHINEQHKVHISFDNLTTSITDVVAHYRVI